MQVYGVTAQQDNYSALYQKAKETPQINYIGSLPQLQLAAALRKCSIFAYPNIFPETSCISVMEAMAAGLFVITSELGALPETCLNMAKINQPY